jgi:hypothetical protein
MYDIERPLYIFKTPSFEKMEECQEYVSGNYMDIYKVASASYNYKHTPEAIYCLTTDAVKSIFKYNYEEQKNETGI